VYIHCDTTTNSELGKLQWALGPEEPIFPLPKGHKFLKSNDKADQIDEWNTEVLKRGTTCKTPRESGRITQISGINSSATKNSKKYGINI